MAFTQQPHCPSCPFSSRFLAMSSFRMGLELDFLNPSLPLRIPCVFPFHLTDAGSSRAEFSNLLRTSALTEWQVQHPQADLSPALSSESSPALSAGPDVMARDSRLVLRTGVLSLPPAPAPLPPSTVQRDQRDRDLRPGGWGHTVPGSGCQPRERRRWPEPREDPPQQEIYRVLTRL